MKKIIIHMLILILLITLVPLQDVAAESTKVSKKQGFSRTQTLYEYDILKGLQQKSSDELMQYGYSKSEAKEIKTTPLSSKSSMGKVTYKIKGYDFKYKNKRTYLTTKTTWKWKKMPVCRFTDIIAMTTGNNLLLRTKKKKYKKNGKVKYKRVNRARAWAFYRYWYSDNGSTYKKLGRPSSTDARRGVFKRFRMERIFRGKGVLKPLEGGMEAKWVIQGNKKLVSIASNYGHTVLGITPSVSLGSGFSIGFTPKVDVRQGVEASANKSRN